MMFMFFKLVIYIYVCYEETKHQAGKRWTKPVPLSWAAASSLLVTALAIA